MAERVTLFVIVEGQTENAFLTRFLGSHLSSIGIDLHCPIVRTGGGRGGVKYLSCPDLCEQIQRHLKERRQPVVTTFFDYYGLPLSEAKGWGFIVAAKSETHIRGVDATAAQIEKGLHQLVVSDMDFPNVKDRFIPYIQLHELEALYFAEPQKTAAVFESAISVTQLEQIVSDCNGCERINDSQQTAPSKRIQALFPNYIKGRSDFAHGPRIAEKLDLTIVRAACPRFDSWVKQLEALASKP